VWVAFSGCGIVHAFKGQNKQIFAIVYTDLTESISKEVADREKQNIAQLFQKLPADSQFYLFEIDRGTSSPDIYESVPHFTVVRKVSDLEKRKQEIEKYQHEKETTELVKLNTALNSYQGSIAGQKGPVSCVTNKLNALLDQVANSIVGHPEYEVRLYFYSDMIEECEKSFDGKPMSFLRNPHDNEERAHIQEIEKRIDENFQQADPPKDLKSMGAKIYIMLTSQDDKQTLVTLKKIWGRLFASLGLPEKDIVWANGNSDLLWQ
jgi:hypothetical protein